MYTLRLLGGFALEVPGDPSPVPLPQRRAEALLALLAHADTLGCTRDRLLVLLWPDHDTVHARHNLRDALHAVRSALGRDAVASVGDSLRLDPARVTSDLQDFQNALAEERFADAVTTYRGPFLDGFHLAGAPEFERWLDDERARLLHECLDAARRLAEAAETAADWRRAAEWWRRATTLDPYNSAAVGRRIQALAQAGDRANAVLEGEAHCGLLRLDLELEPDPSFLEDLDHIRRGAFSRPAIPACPSTEPATAVSRPRPARGLRAPDRDAGPAGEVPAMPVAPGVGRRGRPRARWLAVIALSAAMTLALAFIASRARSRAADLPHLVRPVKVTASLALEEAPSWSADGTALAYAADRSGNWDIWVTQLGTGQAVNRTADNPTNDFQPTWSPDGRWLAFFSEREGGGYFLMPRVGGAARKIATWPATEVYPSPASWSPNSAEMAWARGQHAEPWIEIRSVASGASRKLSLPSRPRNNVVLGLAWSPDGRRLAYWRGNSPWSAISALWLTDIPSGRSVQLTGGQNRDVSPTWSPDSRLLYFVSDRDGTSDIWRFTIDRAGRPRGAARPVTAGIEMTEAGLSADGRRIAYTRARIVRNVFRAPLLPDRRATWADVSQLTYEEVDFESIDVSRRGQLLLSSNRAGNWDVFVMPADGGNLVSVTTDTALDAGPRWNASGSEMVFYSARSGHREVWTQPVGGGPARQITRGNHDYTYPTWSPSGREIAVQQDGPNGIVIVDVATGRIRPLTPIGHVLKPDWSLDGRWISYTADAGGQFAVWRVPAAGGEPEQLTREVGNLPSVPRWSADGSRIYFLRRGEGGDNVWALAMDTREEWPVTDLAGRRGRLGRYTLATDDRFLYFTWEESRSDIWVADFLPPWR